MIKTTFFLALFVTCISIHADTFTTNSTGDGNWSDSSYWEGGTVPSGGSLIFAGSGNSTNNISNLNISNLNFEAGAGAYNISGNELGILNGITNNSTVDQEISLDLLLNGNGIFHANSGNLTIGSIVTSGYDITALSEDGKTITFSSAISSGDSDTPMGNFTKTGNGTVVMLSGGFNSNTVQSGTLQLGNDGNMADHSVQSTSDEAFIIQEHGTLVLDRSIDIYYIGSVSGNGTFIKRGGNTITIASNWNFTGASVIENGTYALHSTMGGVGNVTLSGGNLEMGNPNVSTAADLNINGNLIWQSSNSTIALVNGSKAVISGNLTDGGSPGNRTFDITKIGASKGNYTLATVNGTNSFTSSDFKIYTGSNSSITGSFSITAGSIIYSISSASAGGSSIDVNTPSFADFTAAGTVTAGTGTNTINSIQFQPGSSLNIASGGTVQVTSGQLSVDSGTATVSGGTVTTPGNFQKNGSGNLDLQSNMSVNGTASVEGGLLSVNGRLQANEVAVSQSGTLGGSGIITSNVMVQGKLAPGNSPGILSVAGNLSLGNASTTELEIASLASFDQFIVTGQLTLAGTLNIISYHGFAFEYGQQFVVAQAGSIAGEFSTINAPATFRGRVLNSGTVLTILIAPDSYVRVAVTPNQRNVAKALDKYIPARNGDREVVSIALDRLTEEQYPAAFEQIMPGFYESITDIAIEQAFTQVQLLNQRTQSVRQGTGAFQAIGFQSQPLKHDRNGKSVADEKTVNPISETPTSANWNSWVLGSGSFSRSYNLSEAPGYKNDAGGFLAGADFRWSDSFVTGIYAGYQYNYAKYSGGSSMRGNSALFGAYASWENEDGYYADSIVGGGYTGYQARRSIKFSTIDRTASADPDSGQVTAAINLGKDWEMGNFAFGPILGAQYTYAGVGGFTESGADALDLSLGQQNANSLRTTIGGRLAYMWKIADGIALIPEARMLWMHEFLNNSRTINSALDGGNGPSFGYDTGDPYRDSVFAGAGVSAKFDKDWTASLFYNINFGAQTYQNNIVSAGLNLAF
jgi:outer membrane autotransporter protein